MTSSGPQPLLFAALEARLEKLDLLARQQWLQGLVHSQGRLEARLSALADLRRDLVGGRLAPAADWPWPAPTIARRLAAVITDLRLPGYCAGRQALADLVLTSLLFHLDFIVDYRDRGTGEADAVAMAVESFGKDWQERCGQMDELIEVFGALPDVGQNMNWDLLRGLLHSSGWQAVQRINRHLERLPELERIVRRLGRSCPAAEEDRTRQRSVEAIADGMAAVPRSREVRIPDMPGETRGVTRSDRIARMLPSEAILMRHPKLRLIWHARRAERTLLTYEDDIRLRETRLQRMALRMPILEAARQQRLEAGPIMVCVDTSGSMRGGAESVAKAVVLAAMRSAHSQSRACHLFAFSGPGEVVEMELPMNAAGIERLTNFLGQAFHGGTDIGDPLARALTKLEDEAWRLADLLIASDGEFGATPDMALRLKTAKRELGLRVQGVLVGDRETVGFLELADDIFHVRDWRRYSELGDLAPEAPIPDRRLTAMLFPGALRSQPNYDAVVAAQAVSRGGKPS